MSPRLRVGGRSDVGMQRHDNQDSMYAGPWLIAVADGVGGAAGGEVASRLTINALMSLDSGDITDAEPALRAAADGADASIRETVANHSALSGMGTTLTAMLATDEHLTLAHIGDSRAYRLRNNRLEQLTHDHTLVQALIDEGQITEEEALTHPRRSWIMRALDGRGDPEVDVMALDLEPGDRFLVCSDGLSSYVAAPDIESALAGGDPQAAADRLVNLALRAGGGDNITCIVADVAEADAELSPAILGGAVAEPEPPELQLAATTAQPTAAGSDITDAEQPRRRSIGRRLAAVACIVVILVAAAFAGVAVYIHHQWYVAASDGNVAIYQGVHGNAAGVKLSHVHELTNLPITALPQDDQQRLANRIQASNGLTGANTVVTNLRADACTSITAAPTPSPKVTERNGKRVVVKPTTAPTPAWCKPASLGSPGAVTTP